MKQFFKWLGKHIAGAMVFSLFSIFFISFLVYAINYPSAPPAGEVAGGKFQANFNKIFQTCPAGEVLKGFDFNSGKICTTAPAGPQGPAGTNGATGPTGPQGPAGVGAWNPATSVTRVVSSVGGAWGASVSCNADEAITSCSCLYAGSCDTAVITGKTCSTSALTDTSGPGAIASCTK